MNTYNEIKSTIINGDFLKIFFGDTTVDLTVTSPPYNLNMGYDEVDDLLPYGEYLEWCEEWLAKIYSITNYTGRLCLNIPLDVFNYDQNRQLGERIPISADLIRIALSLGWKYKVAISWDKKNIASRTAWGSFMSASAPHLNNPVENILVFYKGVWKRDKKGESDITKDEFVEWTYGLWSFNGESQVKKLGHPAPFPVELPYRCIKLFSYKDDVIFDPFFGSGSTLVAATALNRKSLGTEISKKYTATTINRLRTDKFLKTSEHKSIEQFIT